jgi:UTP-glucose-1-phosphate uridylyltransferase
MVGVQPVEADELSRVGTCRGESVGSGVYRCTDFVEKPDPATAQARLTTPDLPAGRFLAHCGIYAFSPAIFEHLAARPSGGERELAHAQSLLLRANPGRYFLRWIDGTAYDTGTPANLAKAFAALVP